MLNSGPLSSLLGRSVPYDDREKGFRRRNYLALDKREASQRVREERENTETQETTKPREEGGHEK